MGIVRRRRSWLLAILLAARLVPVESVAAQDAYDPLAVDDAALPPPIDATVHDAARGRDVPVFVYLPADPAPTPVVLFSHGLGGDRQGNGYLGRHWAGRGYVAVFLQHAGSDGSVGKDASPLRQMSALRDAATGENFLLRVRDVSAVLDRLTEWNESGRDARGTDPADGDQEIAALVAGRLDMGRVGMSGHSFGAVTTQAVAGQSFARGRMSMTDSRIKAAVLMSPSMPRRGSAADAFGQVAVPWLLLTGTEDGSPLGDQTPATRRQVYPALPAGDKYQLMLAGAEHSAFGDRPLLADRKARNPNHHRAIVALTTAFWDAYLKQDPAAREWLAGAGPRSVLEEGDAWERK